MTHQDMAASMARNAISQIEQELEAEVLAINRAAVERVMAAMKAAEKKIGPLRLVLAAIGESTILVSQTISRKPTTIGFSASPTKAKRQAKPPANTASNAARDATRIRPAAGSYRGLTHMLGTMLLDNDGTPLSQVTLDHAAMDVGLTRSSGEKARKFLVASGLAERVGKALVLTEKGREKYRGMRDLNKTTAHQITVTRSANLPNATHGMRPHTAH